ncbi:MAG TPA: hypothetical protein VGM82_13265 [Gemmatimonadaceae bacterium]|jgi:hypothetical protein
MTRLQRSTAFLLGATLFVAACHKAVPPAPPTPAATPARAPVSPATSRLALKHGLDREAASLHMTPKPLTVAELSKMPLPPDFKGALEDNQDQRIGDFERQVYSVNATIKSIQLRSDGDYYMEIEGPDGSKSVMEVPDPALCKGSPLQASIAATRKALEARYHPTTAKKEVNDAAILQGIGFYGPRGSQAGGRLMPGLGITFKPVA